MTMAHAPHETAKPRPEALGKSERFLMAARLRQDARDILTVADRIDPEHATLLLVEDKMGKLATNWNAVKQAIADRDARINGQAATIEAAQAAMREQMGQLQAATARVAALETEVAATHALDPADEDALADMAKMLSAGDDRIIVAPVTID